MPGPFKVLFWYYGQYLGTIKPLRCVAVCVSSGSPFLFHVDAVNSGYVTAYGPGLSHGVVHEPAYFTINTKEAGAGTADR